MQDAAAQTNLYAMMQLYPMVCHFLTTEIARRYAELDYSFTASNATMPCSKTSWPKSSKGIP